jgi:hypothetical protein
LFNCLGNDFRYLLRSFLSGVNDIALHGLAVGLELGVKVDNA